MNQVNESINNEEQQMYDSSKEIENNELDSNNIELIIQKLEEDRRSASKDTNYELAEQLRLKISELRVALDITKKRELSHKHQSEINSLEQLFKKELEELEIRFENEYTELDAKTRNFEEKLNEKHKNETEKLHHLLEEKLPRNVKYSKRYLDLKSQEINLAKQQKYKEALLIKKQCEALDMEESYKFNKDKKEKRNFQLIKTDNKHMNEKNTFKRKMENEFEQLKKKKIELTNILIHKYKNRRSELEIQQRAELHLCENKHKLKAKTTTNVIKNKQHLFNTTFLNNDSKQNIDMMDNMNNTYKEDEYRDNNNVDGGYNEEELNNNYENIPNTNNNLNEINEMNNENEINNYGNSSNLNNQSNNMENNDMQEAS